MGPLEVQIATPPSAVATGQLLLLCHGLPLGRDGGRLASRLLPELAERLAGESGWTVAVASLRGVGDTPGIFSARGWRDDLHAVLDALLTDHKGISLVGFGFGGALCLRVAVEDERVRGVAALATPSDLASWCGPPSGFVRACERSGVLDGAVSIDADELVADVLAIDPLDAIAQLPPRRIMIVHGADDAVVPVRAARELVDAAKGRAELRIVAGAGHWLRADPRMVATVLGWIDRQR